MFKETPEMRVEAFTAIVMKTVQVHFQISSFSLINSQRKIAQEKVKMKLNSLAGNLKRKEHQGKEERRR